MSKKECKCSYPNYNPIGRCLICGGFQPAGTYPSLNTQLPDEVINIIHADTNRLYDQLNWAAREVNEDFGLPMISDRQTEPIRNVITEYANKLHQAQQEIERLKKELVVAIGANENLIGRMELWQQQLHKEQKGKDDARTLLLKVIHRHEAGLLPDRFIYNEIKTFLDGK